MAAIKKYLLPAAGYICIVFALFAPVLFPPPGTILFGDDFIHLWYNLRIFVRESLAGGQLPLWNPYLYGGMPLLEYPQIAFWYPFNVLYLILPLSAAFVLHLALHICIAMITMYWLMRRWVDRLPAWLSGLAFGLSTFFWYRIPAGHPDVISAAAWAPLVFGLCMRVSLIGRHFRKKQHAPLMLCTSAVIAIQLLSGYKTMALLTAEAVGVWVIFAVITQRSIRPLWYVAVVGTLGAFLSSAELLGNWMYMKQSVFSLAFPYSWSSVATPSLGHLLEIIDPVAFALWNPASVYLIHERAAYIGSIALVLAAVAIIFAVRRRNKNPVYWFFGALCVLGLWIGFADSMPVDLFRILKDHIPWYQGLRVPTRHFFWFVFGASALAGFGAQLFKPVIIRILFIGMLLYQLIPIAKSQLYLVPAPETYEDRGLISFLQENSGLSRFLMTVQNDKILQYTLDVNAPATHRLYSPYGYCPPPLKNYVEFILAVNHLPRESVYYYFDALLMYENYLSRYTNAFNVKYILLPVWADSLARDASGRFVSVKENVTSGWRVYENKNVLPRFYMVPRAEVLSDRNAVYTAISEEKIDPAQTVLLTRTDANGNLPEGKCLKSDFSDAEVLNYGATDIKLRVNNRCDGYLVSSEVNYPGWRAYIDGKAVKIFEGNLAFRTVFVPSGEHVITFRYIPYVLYIGMGISAVTLIACVFWLWKSRRMNT